MTASVTWTEFSSHKADAKWQRSSTWPDLIERIRAGRGRTKADCPWIKLASFGDKRTPAKSLRHDANVLQLHGVEGDYDGEAVTPDEAIAKLEKAQVKAIVYTSPSHTPEKPRWRVLAPLSHPMPPETRSALLARINGVLGGILSTESFTLSQSYYFGKADDAPEYRVLVAFDDPDEGSFIDDLDDLDDIAVGKDEKKTNGADHEPERQRPGERVFADKVRELGRPHVAGDIVTASLEDALALAESMAGTFLDDDDRARCLQARREAIAKMVGRGSPFLQPGTEGAWQRMH